MHAIAMGSAGEFLRYRRQWIAAVAAVAAVSALKWNDRCFGILYRTGAAA